MSLLVADFETINNPKDCRVWAYSCIEIGNYDNYKWGTNIDEFMWTICADTKQNHEIWFHNLKFDGEFIFYWLFRNGFKHVIDKKDIKSKTFTTLISDKGQFYSICIYFKKGSKTNKVTLYDSLKILNFSVKKIAKDFNLPCLKGEIEYNKERPVGYQLDENEQSYIRNDVEIVARALEIMFKKDMDRMTIGSDALFNYKNMLGKKNFDNLFPVLSKNVDSIIRQSYKGGYTYVSDKYKGKTIDSGIVLDVNSLYPSRMKYELLPIGEPLIFSGKYKKDELYPLYVQCFSCQFELKKDHLPTIQIKNDLDFKSTEYLKSSRLKSGEFKVVNLTLTNIDLELFLEHYNVYNIEYHGGFKFKGRKGLFDNYIDYWTEQKIKAKKEKNGAMYVLSKLMLNSLYGKFALNPDVRSKIPTYDKTNDLVKYAYGEWETRDGIYIPMGTFITAYARNVTIRSAQKCYNRFAYADTDSLHLEGYNIPEGLDISDYKLGAWKNELIFTKGKYVRQKTYMEMGFEPSDVDKIFDVRYIQQGIKASKLFTRKNFKFEKSFRLKKLLNTEYYNPINVKITCAGMPKSCYSQVSFDNFEIGSTYNGKLMPKHVSGGICLLETTFKIKNTNFRF